MSSERFQLFTGIIQSIGTIRSARRSAAGTVFDIQAAGFSESIRPGDSVAVNGVCLTAEKCDADGFVATAVGETLSRTTLGDARVGVRVNLEQAATLYSQIADGYRFGDYEVNGFGLTYSFAHRKAALLYTQLEDYDRAEDHWLAFLDAFTDPDPEFEWMVEEGRSELERLGRGR